MRHSSSACTLRIPFRGSPNARVGVVVSVILRDSTKWDSSKWGITHTDVGMRHSNKLHSCLLPEHNESHISK